MNKSVLKAVLRKNKWFASLPPSLADNILRLGRIRSADDSLIYSASDSRDGMLALIRGKSGSPAFPGLAILPSF